ncbi:hypothetical protein SAMN05216462_1794 [Xylanibacter ruminicola]|uniref:Uncharacterized protein n=1 Tax=Xylanibacter ruminicola TaxID=839 RepID=A0A1H4C6M6_XYLRU|nr:hypothetical protein [Xylanibacter ruminicola]SEA55953.1 hypothetical protein SAMN05216462_1794 [Xylanibacter ruminicola]
MCKFFKECYLQKTNQYDALSVWDQIKELGVTLAISFDEKEKNVIARLESDPSKVIGVISEEDSKSLKPYLEAGWNVYNNKKIDKPLYIGKVSRVDDKADENKRLSICVFIIDASNYKKTK